MCRKLSPILLLPILLLSAIAWRHVPAAQSPATTRGAFTPLFDGKTLAGWKPMGKGTWTVEDGAIVGRHEKGEKEYGHLVSDKSYRDFTVRLKFKSLKGNSGLYFRVAIDPKAFSGLSGFQAEIDPRNDVGGLYETNGRSWVSQPKAEQVARYFKPDDWNEMVVSARGGDLAVTINGVVASDVKGDKGKWTEGPLALQVHGGQEGLVYFKDIEIREE